MALDLAAAGWRVFAGVRREEDAASLAAEAGDLRPLMLEVTDAAAVAAAADAVGARLDGLVNNAGYALPGPLELVPPSALQRQLEVNVVAQVAVTQAMLPALREARGRVVFVSSTSGRVVIPMLGAYAASKHAVEAVGDGFRRELAAWGIGVSLVEPGPVKSRIWEGARGLGGEYADVDPARLELYREAVERLRAGAARAEEEADDASLVAAAVRHALESPRPRTRYPVGRGVAWRLFLARLLPDSWLDRRLGSR